KEILYPEVNDPEPPEITDRKRRLSVCQEADRVERRDRECAVEEQPGKVAPALDGQSTAQPAKDDHHPKHHPDDEQVHPESPQLEVFPPLGAEKRTQPARQKVVVAQVLTGKTSEDDNRKRAQ